ncbi:MAG: hypothetical protein J6J72_03445 [Tyzzerella sp.]|nr:hypothetical protein [Tyzzerella sp.]
MKKRIIPIIILVAFLGGYGAINSIFSADDNAPVYQEITVADSVFEDKFYFEQLTEEEQLIYKELYQGVDAHAEDITVHCMDGEQAGLILHSVIYDFPEIFWTDGSSDTLTYEESHVVVKPTYTYSLEERAVMQAEIDAEVNVILSQISAEVSEYDKIKYIYETLVRDVDYVENAPDNQNIYSTFVRKETVCAGYTKANKYLLERLGVYCIYVLGDAAEESHAWNIVRCNGVMCYVDVTWADPLFSEDVLDIPEEILYDYLCCSDTMLGTTHRADEQYNYPECISDEWEYYHLNQMHYDSVDGKILLDTMRTSINAKEESTTFKFSDEAVYTQGRDMLVNELIRKAGDHLCRRYGLQQVECSYGEYPDLKRFVIYWKYE